MLRAMIPSELFCESSDVELRVKGIRKEGVLMLGSGDSIR
jgi:hypothetical protein